MQVAVRLTGRRGPTRVAQLGHRFLLRGLGIRMQSSGHAPAPGSLLVANHLSYTDVLALGARAPMQFVAKAEVARWPVLGLLARLNPTVFVHRAERGRAGDQVSALAAALRQGRVALFPEGTSSDGRDVLPFRPALLAAAEATGAPVQTVAVSYRPRNGAAPTPDWLARFAWHGEDTFAPHLIRLLREGGAICDIHFFAPVTCVPGSRKRVAAAARNEIRARLGFAQEDGS